MLALLLLLCVPIVVTDLVARRIPNVWLASVALLTLCWLGWRAWQGEPQVLWQHGLGLLLGLAALLPFWWFGLMAAGDVKLFAVIGLVAGYQALLPVWVLASLAAGVHAVVVLWLQSTAGAAWRAQLQGWGWWQRVLGWRAGRIGLPYGAYLAAAALWIR